MIGMGKMVRKVVFKEIKNPRPFNYNNMVNKIRPIGPDVDTRPTPTVNLGKRSRDERSPPSVGSIQGPTQRLFSNLDRNTSEPLDLNTPVGDSSANVEDILPDLETNEDNPAVQNPGTDFIDDNLGSGGGETQLDTIQYNLRKEVEETLRRS
ncbi:hypothetical protein Hanom_Chr10g00906411 [Helianthus anomalus]